MFRKHGRKRKKRLVSGQLRERGDNYHMNPDNDWHKQMDAFEDWFKGKTVAEIEEAFNTMFSIAMDARWIPTLIMRKIKPKLIS